MKLEQANAMTLQELFDYAIEKLVAQGKQCTTPGGACQYSDRKGNHCGIGWLLDESDRDLMTSHEPVPDLVRDPALRTRIPLPILENEDTALIFQNLHDSLFKESRAEDLGRLRFHGINTDNPAYQAWVAMGR